MQSEFDKDKAIKEELARFFFHVLECTSFYTSKKDVEIDFQKLKTKYTNDNNLNYNLNYFGNYISVLTELDSICKSIEWLVDTNCRFCNKAIVVKDNLTAKYYAECFECKDEHERQKEKEFLERHRKEAEINPLITYCHDINSKRQPYEEGPQRTKEQRLKGKEDYYVRTRLESDGYLQRLLEMEEPYDPDSGMSKAEWERKKKNEKRLMKQERKEYESDSKLKTNTPTWQVLEKLEKVRFDGCICEAEYLRRGQVCTVCRLMKQVYEYALDIFKNAAQGRSSMPSVSH